MEASFEKQKVFLFFCWISCVLCDSVPVGYAENFRGGGKVSSQSCDVKNQL